MSAPHSEQHTSIIRIITVITPFVIGIAGWITSQINDLEKQIYESKATYVTREELNNIISRLEGNLTIHLGRIESRLVDNQDEARREVDGVNARIGQLDEKLTVVLEDKKR